MTLYIEDAGSVWHYRTCRNGSHFLRKKVLLKVEIRTIEEMKTLADVIATDNGIFDKISGAEFLFGKMADAFAGQIVEVEEVSNPMYKYRSVEHNWFIPEFAVKNVIAE